MTEKKTEYLTFEGFLSWAKVYVAETNFGKSEWTLDFFPKDDAELKKIKDSGIQKTVKENTDPTKGPVGKYIKFSRPENKLIKGQIVNYTGPIVTDQDGGVIVDYVSKSTGKRVFSYAPSDKGDILRRGSPILMGNGTKAQVTVSVYDTLKGKGHKLETVKILELVEYSTNGKEPPPLSKMVGDAPLKGEPGPTANSATPW